MQTCILLSLGKHEMSHLVRISSYSQMCLIIFIITVTLALDFPFKQSLVNVSDSLTATNKINVIAKC